jgi:carbon monoxide dehydrogenase subunit G
MASIHKEIQIAARPEDVWNAVRDFGAVHKRVAPGFLTDCRMEPDGSARVVTFANALVARELLVDLDDNARRLVWSVVGGRPTHHNASMQIFPDGEDRSRVVWIADLLPNELAGPIGAMIEQGLGAMKQTLERR